MSYDSVLSACKLAKEIRGAINLSSPLDIKKVVESLGGEVVFFPGGMDAPLMTITKKGDGFIISLRESLDEFLSCHLAIAIGHLFLHVGFSDPDAWACAKEYVASVERRVCYSLERDEASMFGLELLMPMDELLAALKVSLKDGCCDLSEVGNCFGVPETMVMWRCNYLGLIDRS